MQKTLRAAPSGLYSSSVIESPVSTRLSSISTLLQCGSGAIELIRISEASGMKGAIYEANYVLVNSLLFLVVAVSLFSAA